MIEELQNWIQIIVFIASVIGLYIKFRVDMAKIRYDIDGSQTCINKLNTKMDNIDSTIVSISADKKYEKELINSILAPLVDNLNNKIVGYVDMRVEVINKEVEMIRKENQEFKTDLKELLKDFKSETLMILNRFNTDK